MAFSLKTFVLVHMLLKADYRYTIIIIIYFFCFLPLMITAEHTYSVCTIM